MRVSARFWSAATSSCVFRCSSSASACERARSCSAGGVAAERRATVPRSRSAVKSWSRPRHEYDQSEREAPIFAYQSGNHRGLEQVARRIGEESWQLVQADPVGDQLLPRIGAAGQERERGTNGARRVVEGAAERDLLVMELVGVERDALVAWEPAEEDHGPSFLDQSECPTPRRGRSGRVD